MKVFISYRRSDSPGSAGRLFDHLEARFGNGNVFMDVDSNMPLGIDFREYLTNRIELADAVVVIIGPAWLRSIQEKADDPKDFVRMEIEAALNCGKPLIPVVMGAVMPEEEDLPPSIAKLAYLNGMTVDVGPDFRHHAQKLCSKLESSVGAISGSSEASAPAPGTSHRRKAPPKSISRELRSGKIDWKDVFAQILGAVVGGIVGGIVGAVVASVLPDGSYHRSSDNIFSIGLLGGTIGMIGCSPFILIGLMSLVMTMTGDVGLGLDSGEICQGFSIAIMALLGILIACRNRHLERNETKAAMNGWAILGFIGIIVAAWRMNRRKPAVE